MPNDESAIVDLLETLAAEVRELRSRLDRPAQRFLTVEQSAAFTGLSAESVRRLISGGRLTALRPVKGRIVLDREQLAAFVLSSTATPRKGRGRHP